MTYDELTKVVMATKFALGLADLYDEDLIREVSILIDDDESGEDTEEDYVAIPLAIRAPKFVS